MFLKRITGAYKKAFEKAARSVKNSSGECGSVDFRAERDYEAFRMPKSSPPVKAAQKAGVKMLRIDVLDENRDYEWY